MLYKVNSLFKETSCDIPDLVIDRAHQLGKGYNNKKQMYGVKVLFYVLHLLYTEQCFIGVELIKK